MTGSHNVIQHKLAELFAQDLHIEVPSSDADLLASARLDSLGVIELIMQIERRFEVRVNLDALRIDDFRTLDSIAAFIAVQLRETGVGSTER